MDTHPKPVSPNSGVCVRIRAASVFGFSPRTPHTAAVSMASPSRKSHSAATHPGHDGNCDIIRFVRTVPAVGTTAGHREQTGGMRRNTRNANRTDILLRSRLRQ